MGIFRSRRIEAAVAGTSLPAIRATPVGRPRGPRPANRCRLTPAKANSRNALARALDVDGLDDDLTKDAVGAQLSAASAAHHASTSAAAGCGDADAFDLLVRRYLRQLGHLEDVIAALRPNLSDRSYTFVRASFVDARGRLDLVLDEVYDPAEEVPA